MSVTYQLTYACHPVQVLLLNSPVTGLFIIIALYVQSAAVATYGHSPARSPSLPPLFVSHDV